MDAPLFYTPLAEFLKIGLYLILATMILIGIFQRQQKKKNWANWIHAAILIHFLVGAFYSGVRMISMDAINHLLIRRIYACEAWFNFACAAFYFLVLEHSQMKRA